MNIGQLSDTVIRYSGTLFFLTLCFIIMGIIYSINAKQYIYSFIYVIVFVFCLFYVLTFENICNELDKHEAYLFPWIGYFKKMPASLILVSLIIMLISNVFLWIHLRKRIKNILTPVSLEEGLAKLPDGVYFENADGVLLLINRKMQEIVNELFEKPFDGNNLRNKLTEGKDIRPESRLWHNDAGTFAGLSDGTVWDINCREIPIRRGRQKTSVYEILAYDITKRYNKSVELEERNKRLNEINDRLREYSRNLDTMTREKEMLNAKIKLHDNVGRCLLALRAYISSNSKGEEAGYDRRHLEELWKSTIAILNNEAERDSDENRMEIIKKAADAVNVKLEIQGEIIEDMEELVAAAIQECLTNTVKHADGDRLNVYIDDAGTVTITNSGRPPEKEIKESGGLKNLRNIVERQGCSMTVESFPQFKLIIAKDI